jgi:hypothetical protein
MEDITYPEQLTDYRPIGGGEEEEDEEDLDDS